MTPSKIVILEANQNRREYIRSIVSDRGYISYIFEKETICLDNLLSLDPDLVISGPLSNSRVFRFVNTVKLKNCNLPVLIISGDRSLRDSAVSNGFGDVKVIKNNFEPSEIKGAINNLLLERVDNGGNGDSKSPMIIGSSPEILKIKKFIFDQKSSREPVLIQGEPGTGKELVARALHYHSNHRSHPLVKVNLAELDFAMLDEIFSDNLPRKFTTPGSNACETESVDNFCTMFLDEVAALPALHQSRLLNIFEDGYFQHDQSGPIAIKCDEGRMIFSSNRHLGQLVQQGKFRQDLFYRLNVISLIIPPLRDRAGDIPLLMDFFADKFCMELGVGHIELSSKFKDIFCSYRWPGNVRELQTFTRKVILNGDKDSTITNISRQQAKKNSIINARDDVDTFAGISSMKKDLKDSESLSLKNVCNVFLSRTEKKIITKALEQTNWNRKKAAGLLDISYKSLLNKIKEYQLS